MTIDVPVHPLVSEIQILEKMDRAGVDRSRLLGTDTDLQPVQGLLLEPSSFIAQRDLQRISPPRNLPDRAQNA